MYIKGKKGFTLIELLVTISIIGILSSITITSLSIARMKARDSKRIDDIRAITIAINMYADQNGKYPQAGGCAYDVSYCFAHSYAASEWNILQASLAPYINSLPKDPINDACSPWTITPVCYSYAYGNVGTGAITTDNINGVTSYDIEARLETPGHSQSAAFQKPKYNFYKGQLPGGYSPQIYMPEMR